jgi:hypothetical protein
VNKQTTELAIHDPKIAKLVENICRFSAALGKKVKRGVPPPPSRPTTKEHTKRARDLHKAVESGH